MLFRSLLPMARLPELSLRFLVLLLPMGTGFLSLLLLPCAVLLFPPSSDGVYMAPDVLNFCFLQKSSNLLWLFILGCHPGRYYGSGTFMEHCGDL